MKISIIGAGHIGLPLGLSFASKGHSILFLDKDKSLLESYMRGEVPFVEPGCQEGLERALKGNLVSFSDNLESISDSDVWIVCIGTPVDRHHNPDLRVMVSLFESLLPHYRDQLVILRSTVYPGTTQHLGAKYPQIHGNLAFCPERISQGNAFVEMGKFPQIVSGLCEGAANRARELFLEITSKVIMVSCGEAELSKLFCNVYRYIQFAIANQFYTVSESLNLDYDKIEQAMTEDYPRMKGLAKPGFAAGACLLKDCLQLISFQRNRFPLGQAAMEINEGLPQYVVDKLKEANPIYELRGEKTVGVLGLAFKGGIDDTRDSLAYKLMNLLRFEGFTVLCSDPMIKVVPPLLKDKDVVDRSDILIVAAAHPEYASLQIPSYKEVIDLFGILPKREPLF